MASSTTQRNGPAGLSRARRVAALLATLLVVALGTGAAVWSWSPAPPPPAQVPATATDPLATEAVEASAATSEFGPREGPARSEAAAPRTAVVGRVLDHGGGPVAGFRVALGRTDPKPVPNASLAAIREHGRYPPVFTETDAAGDFVFEPLDAGNYRCFVSGLESHAEEFALGAGEVRELTLQSPLVALTGTLYRRCEVVKDCLVEFRRGKEPDTLRPDKTGVMRLFAAPGRYDVIVRVPPGTHRTRIKPSPCLSRHVLVVPDGVPALQWSFETGGTEIVFAVEDPQGNAIDNHVIDIVGVGEFDQEPGHYALYGTCREPTVMAALPAGRWRATVTSDVYRVEPRDFVTGLADGRVVLSMAASPAASLRLQLRPSSPFYRRIEPQRMPALVVDGCAVPCQALDTPRDSRPMFTYWAVPPGKATLCFQDRIDGDELVVLPFEPIAPVTIDLAIGRNEVAVDVEPRAFVDLRGCDASGMEMSTAVLTVWVDGRVVRSRDAGVSQRWFGWLPRGVHRVVVDRKGTQREHALRVGRTHVSERYRP